MKMGFLLLWSLVRISEERQSMLPWSKKIGHFKLEIEPEVDLIEQHLPMKRTSQEWKRINNVNKNKPKKLLSTSMSHSVMKETVSKVNKPTLKDFDLPICNLRKKKMTSNENIYPGSKFNSENFLKEFLLHEPTTPETQINNDILYIEDENSNDDFESENLPLEKYNQDNSTESAELFGLKPRKSGEHTTMDSYEYVIDFLGDDSSVTPAQDLDPLEYSENVDNGYYQNLDPLLEDTHVTITTNSTYKSFTQNSFNLFDRAIKINKETNAPSNIVNSNREIHDGNINHSTSDNRDYDASKDQTLAKISEIKSKFNRLFNLKKHLGKSYSTVATTAQKISVSKEVESTTKEEDRVTRCTEDLEHLEKIKQQLHGLATSKLSLDDFGVLKFLPTVTLVYPSTPNMKGRKMTNTIESTTNPPMSFSTGYNYIQNASSVQGKRSTKINLVGDFMNVTDEDYDAIVNANSLDNCTESFVGSNVTIPTVERQQKSQEIGTIMTMIEEHSLGPTVGLSRHSFLSSQNTKSVHESTTKRIKNILDGILKTSSTSKHQENDASSLKEVETFQPSTKILPNATTEPLPLVSVSEKLINQHGLTENVECESSPGIRTETNPEGNCSVTCSCISDTVNSKVPFVLQTTPYCSQQEPQNALPPVNSPFCCIPQHQVIPQHQLLPQQQLIHQNQLNPYIFNPAMPHMNPYNQRNSQNMFNPYISNQSQLMINPYLTIQPQFQENFSTTSLAQKYPHVTFMPDVLQPSHWFHHPLDPHVQIPIDVNGSHIYYTVCVGTPTKRHKKPKNKQQTQPPEISYPKPVGSVSPNIAPIPNQGYFPMHPLWVPWLPNQTFFLPPMQPTHQLDSHPFWQYRGAPSIYDTGLRKDNGLEPLINKMLQQPLHEGRIIINSKTFPDGLYNNNDLMNLEMSRANSVSKNSYAHQLLVEPLVSKNQQKLPYEQILDGKTPPKKYAPFPLKPQRNSHFKTFSGNMCSIHDGDFPLLSHKKRQLNKNFQNIFMAIAKEKRNEIESKNLDEILANIKRRPRLRKLLKEEAEYNNLKLKLVCSFRHFLVKFIQESKNVQGAEYKLGNDGKTLVQDLRTFLKIPLICARSTDRFPANVLVRNNDDKT